jgi:hypothetical protein
MCFISQVVNPLTKYPLQVLYKIMFSIIVSYIFTLSHISSSIIDYNIIIDFIVNI